MKILDFLAPRSCVFCGSSSRPPEKNICAGCFADLPWNEPPVSPLPGVFERNVAMLRYSFPVDVAIKALKFDRKLFYVPAFAEILSGASCCLPDDIDALLPVPLHWRRKARRGFNQASELAKPIAKQRGIPVERGVIRRKATPFQSGLAAQQRTQNLRHAFVATRDCRYEHVLIVDDVITTGATVETLAKTILAAGAHKVSVLAVARAG
jgi:ComF family protein